MDNQAGLFDLPDREPPAASERTRGGRNRETWTRTATADVTIVDAGSTRGCRAGRGTRRSDRARA